MSEMQKHRRSNHDERTATSARRKPEKRSYTGVWVENRWFVPRTNRVHRARSSYITSTSRTSGPSSFWLVPITARNSRASKKEKMPARDGPSTHAWVKTRQRYIRNYTLERDEEYRQRRIDSEQERRKGARREEERERKEGRQRVHQAKLTLLHSRASALCSSFCLKQLLHLLLLNMFGANFLHSAPVPRTPAVPPDIATRAN